MPTFSSASMTRSLRSADFIPRYVSGSSTFSYTLRSPIRLKLWKMKPISRLRTRARSESGRSATDLPLRMYLPSVGESRSPRIDSSVDFPQPDGPAMAMYSPLLISRWIPASACVSTSSVKKTFVTPSRWISVGAALFILAPYITGGLRPPDPLAPSLAGAPCPAPLRPARLPRAINVSIQSNAVESILRGCVRQDHLIARFQTFEDLLLVHGALSELLRLVIGLAAVRFL